MAYNVAPAFEALKSMGINAKDWAIKLAKSKTILFSTLVTMVGAAEMYTPFIKPLLGEYYGAILAGIGITSAILRFVTTTPLSEK